MKLAEIEAWAVGVVERVVGGFRNEDARVELKAEWPSDTARAARQIGGHANAARGDDILWVVGVDEKAKQVVAVAPEDCATWYPQVQRHFDGQAPTLTNLAVTTRHGTVHALHFYTDRAPFVVRNAAAGRAGEKVDREVPWREGASTRSAFRDELLRILVPRLRSPTITPISAQVSMLRGTAAQATGEPGGLSGIAGPPALGTTAWSVEVALYVVVADGGRLVLPRHTAALSIQPAGWDKPVMLAGLTVSPDTGHVVAMQVRHGAESVIDGAGRLDLSAKFVAATRPLRSDQPLVVRYRVTPAGLGAPVTVDCTLHPADELSGDAARWVDSPRRSIRYVTAGGLTTGVPIAEDED